MQKILRIHDKEAVEAMLAHVVSECRPIDQEAVYNDMLDECYSFESVGGIFASMSPSRVLKEVDPTAYRCGMNDYFGNGEQYEIGSDLYEKDAVNEASEEFIDGLRSELTDLEIELEALEFESDEGETGKSQALLNQIDKAKDAIARKESAIEACESHQW